MKDRFPHSQSVRYVLLSVSTVIGTSIGTREDTSFECFRAYATVWSARRRPT
jgi:hypothetical protein